MRKTLLSTITAAFLRAVLLSGACFTTFAQTAPTAQTIPFSLTSVQPQVLPAGVAVHRFASVQTTRPVSPGTADLVALASNAGENAGGWRSEGTNGILGIGMLASNSAPAGAVVVALDTRDKSGLVVKWKARIRYLQGSRDNSLAIQARIGNTGNFTNLGSVSEVFSTTTYNTVGDSASYSLALPDSLAGIELLQLRWVYWESAGSSGSRDRIALDDVSIEEEVTGPDITAPTISALAPADNAINVQTTAALSLTFSENVVKNTGSFTITNANDNTTQVIDVASANVTVAGAKVSISGVTLVNSTSYHITLTANSFADEAGNDFAGIADAQTWNFTTIAPPGTVTKISAIQGSGQLAALTGEYTIEGIVTRTFPGATGLSGFYVQEEDADADGDPLTSEAIFVYNVSADPVGEVSPSQGDKVRLTGEVIDFVSTTSGVTTRLTEIKTLTTFENLGASSLPTPVAVKLPVANVADLERYEGMLADLSANSGNLAVTEFFELGRYGQVLLSVDGATNQPGTDARLDQYTQFNAPSVSGYAAYMGELAKRQIILDDGSTRQNPDPIIFGRGGNPLSAGNTLRGGDLVSNIIGILDERLEGYRIQSATGINFQPANERPATIPGLAASGTTPSLRIASANVLNYFVNLDVSGDEYRGANTAAEFERQKAKIVKALIRSQGDVIGLMEIQSNGATPITALKDLENGLNADPEGSGTYAFIDPATTGASISTDAITVGILYKKDKVTPLGNAATLTTSPAFDLVGRRPLAQTFTQNSNGEVFSVVVNHFKSKGSSSGGEGDADANDGQGFSNGTRSRQATDLASWLATRPTGTTDPDYLILGDLNAYAKENPITILETAGYGNLLPASSYSYVFDGQFGSLDHALASKSLSNQVTGAAKWHINADEPSVLDYNTEFKSTGQVASLYSGDHYRAADHDPVLVGLFLDKSLPVTYISFSGNLNGGKVTLNWKTSQETDNEGFEVLRSGNGRDFEAIGYVEGNATTTQQSTYSFDDHQIESGKIYYYRLKQMDLNGNMEMSRVIAVKTASSDKSVIVFPNPGAGQFTLSGKDVNKASVKMFSVLGEQIQVTVSPAESGDELVVTAKTRLLPGLYYVNFTTGSGVNDTVKVVVQ
ncbi:ExeM/NucH family extracellular endonuclease [Dyadobacter sp. CY261]|uniref:ExeM/NucH family extracellular endonuclease n=1 Tax=Dyadobacter sp. CY261 TaxID=2907203 RepID=UPI001F30E639|nr:ExeM/NucH family extracellular endonuclease [Dyadobacter sp. CY261]MCF0072906.1 ExeM/NucH family extracellular endonuclease [Dyadobacter sp. CY261]